MGPHSFERGNLKQLCNNNTQRTLQWGLTLSSEETRRDDAVAECGGVLQWGLTLSSEETRGTTPGGSALATLQWGLTLSSEETRSCVNSSVRQHPASMGPHSFERGNWYGMASWSSSEVLQWGLTLSSEETRFRQQLPPRPHGASMGPHSFERGNLVLSSGLTPSSICFNGASLFRARKRGVFVS